MSSITMDITMVIANSAASAPEMMVGNSHSHAYESKYQGKIIDCMYQNRPSITTRVTHGRTDRQADKFAPFREQAVYGVC